MKNRVIGLEMSKKQKNFVVIGLPVAVFCLLFYIVLSFLGVKPKDRVELPKGGLSKSIFESQNLVYKSEEAFQQKNSFQNIPYTIDTVQGQKASIGAANVYEYAPYFFYYSELKEKTDLFSVLQKELTSIVSISATPERTQIEVLYEEDGFVNGCAAKYFVLKVTVTDMQPQKTTYLSLYRLHLDESIYITNWDILVGCMSEDYSTEGLAALQTLSYSSIGSLRLDEKTLRKMQSEQ